MSCARPLGSASDPLWVEHRLTQPRSPTTTGKIERFHRSLRAEFLTGRVFPDLPTAQRELDDWVRYYNTERPHQACDMQPPCVRFQQLPDDRCPHH